MEVNKVKVTKDLETYRGSKTDRNMTKSYYFKEM